MPLKRLQQHLSRGEYVQARREAERIIQLSEVCGTELVQTYRLAALANYHLRELYAAIKLAETGLELAQALADTTLAGKLRYDLGEYYLTLGDLHLARLHLEECLHNMAEYRHIPGLEPRVYHNLGLVLRQRRQQPEALHFLHRAVDTYRETGHQRQAIEAVRAVVWCYLDTGAPQDAWPYIQQVAGYLVAHEDPGLSASLLTDLAQYHRLAGDIQASMDFCEEALIPGRPGVDDHILATATVITGENALDIGRYQEAHMFANLAMDYALKAKHPFLMNRAAGLRRRLKEEAPCSTLDDVQ